jgi:hypothetical protein
MMKGNMVIHITNDLVIALIIVWGFIACWAFDSLRKGKIRAPQKTLLEHLAIAILWPIWVFCIIGLVFAFSIVHAVGFISGVHNSFLPNNLTEEKNETNKNTTN